MSFEIVCDDVLKRLAELYGVTTDIELSKKLGVASQTVSTWRNRNKIPYEKVVEIAAEKAVSLDLLIFGQPNKAESGYVHAELMQYLFEGLDDELFLQERIANESLGFDLLCRAYNSTIMSLHGLDLDLSDQRVRNKADEAIKDVIGFYNDMLKYISGSNSGTKGAAKGRAAASTATPKANQSFHGSVGQVGGGDIHNYGDKDK